MGLARGKGREREIERGRGSERERQMERDREGGGVGEREICACTTTCRRKRRRGVPKLQRGSSRGGTFGTVVTGQTRLIRPRYDLEINTQSLLILKIELELNNLNSILSRSAVTPVFPQTRGQKSPFV